MQHLTASLVKPRQRGRFGDRNTWERIHRDRLERYAGGDDIAEIARLHQVRREAISYSVRRSLTRMPAAQAAAIRDQRWHRRNDWKRLDAWLTEMEVLFGLCLPE